MPEKRRTSDIAKQLSKLNRSMGRALRTDHTCKDHHTNRMVDALHFRPLATKQQRDTHKANTDSSPRWYINNKMAKCLRAIPIILTHLMDNKAKSINSVSTKTSTAEIHRLVNVVQRAQWLTISGLALGLYCMFLFFCCSWSKMQLIP